MLLRKFVLVRMFIHSNVSRAYQFHKLLVDIQFVRFTPIETTGPTLQFDGLYINLGL